VNFCLCIYIWKAEEGSGTIGGGRGGEEVGEEEGRERGLRGKQEECVGGVWGKIQNSHLAAKMKQHTHTLTLPSLLLTTR